MLVKFSFPKGALRSYAAFFSTLSPASTSISLTAAEKTLVPDAPRVFQIESKVEKEEKDAKLQKKLKYYRPITPGLRHRVDVDRSELHKKGPLRLLTTGKRKKGGRGQGGQVSTRHRGGGCKKLYRFVDFKRDILDIPCKVVRLEYDPNRTAYIALVEYQNTDKELRYIPAPQDVEPGQLLLSSKEQELPLTPGNCMPLKLMPIGTLFHNLELKPGKGAQIARSAGQTVEVIDKYSKKGFTLVRLPSTELRYFKEECRGVIGRVSNPLHDKVVLGKAGRSRWRGRRPHVRGVAMNPVDHPHGGGSAKTKGGRPSCSPTGVPAKGYRTRTRPLNENIFQRRGAAQKSIEVAE